MRKTYRCEKCKRKFFSTRKELTLLQVLDFLQSKSVLHEFNPEKDELKIYCSHKCYSDGQELSDTGTPKD